MSSFFLSCWCIFLLVEHLDTSPISVTIGKFPIFIFCSITTSRDLVLPDSKVHGANMGPICGPQDSDGPHVGPMNLAIWACMIAKVAKHNIECRVIYFVSNLLWVCTLYAIDSHVALCGLKPTIATQLNYAPHSRVESRVLTHLQTLPVWFRWATDIAQQKCDIFAWQYSKWETLFASLLYCAYLVYSNIISDYF